MKRLLFGRAGAALAATINGSHASSMWGRTGCQPNSHCYDSGDKGSRCNRTDRDYRDDGAGDRN